MCDEVSTVPEMSTRTEENIPHHETHFTLFAKLLPATTVNYVQLCFQCYKKATHKGGALNKMIYVIVQSTFPTNNNKKRLVACTVFERSDLVRSEDSTSSHRAHPELQ